MVVLSAREVVRGFGLRTVLDSVSLSIAEGQRVGLVGRNGTGKSTLGRLLAGLDEPDGGTITRQRGASVAYLEQLPALPGQLSARAIVIEGMRAWTEAKRRHEAVSAAIEGGVGDLAAALQEQAEAAAAIERLGGWEREHEADAVLDHLGVDRPEALAGTLSGGEARRVALARLLVSRPDVAIFDEPTNHLDIETIEWLERHLVESFAGAVVLITHDRYLLDRVVERTFELDDGKLYAYEGGFEAYLEAKAERLAHAQRTEANRRNYLRRELEWLRRRPKARTSKSKARVARVTAALQAQSKTDERSVEIETAASRSGRTILDAADLTLSIGDRVLVDGLDLALSKGDRIGIIGPNGAGKTTLLRALVGELEPRAGTVKHGKNTRIAFLDQTRSGLDPADTVFEAVSEGRGHVEVGGRQLEVRAWLEKFLFEPAQQRQGIGTLSGGERARVALAKLLAEPANLLVLDEPTNDLDIDTLAAVEDALVEYQGSCLVVTHDRWFLDRVATSILAFEGNGRVVRYEGDYDTVRRLRRQADDASEGTAAKPASPETRTQQPAEAKPKGLTYAESMELQRIEAQVEAADAEVAALEAELADPATYAEGDGRARELAGRLETAKAEATRLFARWEQLETKRSAPS